jgi:hypothetical protein
MSWTYFINNKFHLYLRHVYAGYNKLVGNKLVGPTYWGSPDHPIGPTSPAKVAWSMSWVSKPISSLWWMLCFLSMAQDQLTWIQGSTCETNRCDNQRFSIKHTPWQVGTTSRSKREVPPTIGGRPTPLGSPDGQVGPEASTTLVHASMHAKQSIPLINGITMAVWCNYWGGKARKSLMWHPLYLHL